MKIKIDEHAKERAEERGATEEEIVETIETGISLLARGDRLAKEKTFSFRREWNQKFYEEKQIKVIYFNENGLIIVITVIVKYGTFKTN